MVRSSERLCAHSGLLFAALLGIGLFLVTGWFPPIQPVLDATAIQSMFMEDRTQIRIGVSILAAASVFWWSFSATIAMQMKEIEGRSHPLTYVQMASATGTVFGIFLPAYLWLAAAYRPEMSPDNIQVFNDMAWLMIIGAYPPVCLQAVALGVCILKDTSEVKRFPRWVGFLNFWSAILFLPGALLPFFKEGPFAWNGILGFWMVAVVFFGWIIVLWWTTLQAIDTSEKLDQADY